jgi:DNA-binding transcriptional LysR family regulator
MDVKDLELFRELILSQSYTDLSKQKNIQKSKLSRIVTALEAEIGHKLIERTSGRSSLKLTEKGKIIFERIPSLVDNYNDMLRTLNQYTGLPKELTIYTTNLMIEDWIVDALPKLIEMFPDYTFSFMARNSLISSEEKASLITISPRTNPNELFRQFDLLDFHVKLWASQDYLEKYGIPETLKDLEEHRLLVFATKFDDKTYPNVNWFIDRIQNKNFKVTCLNSSKALIEAASLGIGIISLSEEAILAHSANLVPILQQVVTPRVTMSLSFPAYLEGNPVMMQLYELFREHFHEKYRFLSKKNTNG